MKENIRNELTIIGESENSKALKETRATLREANWRYIRGRRAAFRRFIDFMHAHPGEEVSNLEAAKAVGLHPTALHNFVMEEGKHYNIYKVDRPYKVKRPVFAEIDENGKLVPGGQTITKQVINPTHYIYSTTPPAPKQSGRQSIGAEMVKRMIQSYEQNGGR